MFGAKFKITADPQGHHKYLVHENFGVWWLPHWSVMRRTDDLGKALAYIPWAIEYDARKRAAKKAVKGRHIYRFDASGKRLN